MPLQGAPGRPGVMPRMHPGVEKRYLEKWCFLIEFLSGWHVFGWQVNQMFFSPWWKFMVHGEKPQVYHIYKYTRMLCIYIYILYILINTPKKKSHQKTCPKAFFKNHLPNIFTPYKPLQAQHVWQTKLNHWVWKLERNYQNPTPKEPSEANWLVIPRSCDQN